MTGHKTRWIIAIGLMAFVLVIPTQGTSASQATSLSFNISGKQSVFATPSLDICAAVHISSCPLYLTVYENFMQQVTMSSNVDQPVLQLGQTASLTLTPIPSAPTDSLDFVFTAGGYSYTYNYPVTSLPAIGSTSVLDIPIPIGTVMVALGLPSIPGLYFDVNSQVGTDLTATAQGTGFDQSASYSWTSSSAESDVFQFSGGIATATLGYYLQSGHDWQTSLSVGVPILGSVTLYTAPESLARFSSSSQTAFTWYQVSAVSQYSTAVGSGWYLSGASAQVSVQNSPVSGGQGIQEVFTGWQGQYQGAQQSIGFLVNGPVTETALWQTQYYLTVNSAYGTPSPVSGWYNAGSSVSSSVESPISGGTGVQYAVTGWTGTGSVEPIGSEGLTTFTMNAPSAVTWNWETQYSVTSQASVGGTMSPSGTQWYNSGYQLQLSESPSSGYQFAGWKVNGQTVSTSQSFTLAVSSPSSITAEFSPAQQPVQQQTYSVPSQSSQGTGMGSVSGFVVNLAFGAGIGGAVTAAIVVLLLRRKVV